jgi:hypothetical protein
VSGKLTKIQIAWEMVQKKTGQRFTARRLAEYIKDRHHEIEIPKNFIESVSRTLGIATKQQSQFRGLSDNIRIRRDDSEIPYEYEFFYLK